MDRLAIGEMTLDCDRLGFGVSPAFPDDLRRIPGFKTPWEMIAEGGVVVRANTEERGLYELTANRASYESVKAWLIVEGSPSRSAFINQTRPDGTQGLKLTALRLALNLKTYDTQAMIKEAQINQRPTR